jgi:predicted RNA-binding Zn ribbon-like protein
MEYSTIGELTLDGGCVVFDFTNTIGSRKENPQRDYMKTYSDFLEWVKRQSILPSERFDALSVLTKRDQDKTNAAFKKIIETREVLYSLFSPLATNEKPKKETVDRFNTLLQESFSSIRMNIGNNKNEVNFTDGSNSCLEPLHIVLKSAFDVLTQEDATRIKECPSCGWLFLDKTKNKKRRWCNMLDCGSKDKASRYYHRKKAALDNETAHQ